jgi:hypothetical protein
VRPLFTLLTVAALAGGLTACGNHTPSITVTSQAANRASGRVITQTTSTTASVAAQTATLHVIEQTQVQLQRMYSDTHSLATPDGVGVHDAQSELEDVSRQFNSIAHAAQLLPRNDPARALLIHADEALRNAAAALQHVTVGSTTQSRILAVSDPVRHLLVDVGRIGRQVNTTDQANMHADLYDLSEKVAQLSQTSSG